jgi:hypothetical protein
MSETKEKRYQIWDVCIVVPHAEDDLSSTIKGSVWLPEEFGAMQAIVTFAAKHGADSGALRYAEAEIGNGVRIVREPS